MFGPIGGFVPGVFPVGAGQLLFAKRKELPSWRQWWKYRHVAVVVQAAGIDRPYRDGPRIVQAMPSGAEEIEIGAEHWTDEFVYVRPDYQHMANPESWLNLPYKAAEYGFEVAERARHYVGTPYSFLDYAAITLHHLDPVWRISPASVGSQPLARYIRSTGHMICSQLADQAMSDVGFHVFDDGRLPQDVMPAELYRKLIAMPGTITLRPGADSWVSKP
jgi:hypothetical protein